MTKAQMVVYTLIKVARYHRREADRYAIEARTIEHPMPAVETALRGVRKRISDEHHLSWLDYLNAASRAAGILFGRGIGQSHWDRDF